MVPAFLYTEPETVRPLLMYRYAILDKARERAAQLQGPGACYSWNSITGEECCVVFEAATAEYHLQNAVAYGISRYVQQTGDTAFLHEFGAEMVFETARFLHGLGGYVPSRDNMFCINAVCGPDEYGCGVNNNCYTNVMTQWHFRYAAQIHSDMARNVPEQLADIASRTGLKPEEPEQWVKAADSMYIPYSSELGIHMQDDSFIYLEPVDMDLIPKNTDIRETMHPLNLWRKQVVKQADTVLLMFVMGHLFSAEQKKANYEYYEPKTCHGSSLSASIHSILASETGHAEQAYYYFRQSALMDLNDFKNNTSGGIHSASLGGTWMAVVNGFAGMRDRPDGLMFNPSLPSQWDSCSFMVVYRDSRIRVDLGRDASTFTLTDGPACTFKVRDSIVELTPDNPVVRVQGSGFGK
jgi:alpha,alpha-trehalose phosphorylase